jgi:hypothetical protein
MLTTIYWQQLAFFVEDYPRGTLGRFYQVMENIRGNINKEDKNIETLSCLFINMINLHRIAYAISRVHSFDSLEITESYHYWISYGKELENKLDSELLPIRNDLFSCAQDEIIDVFMQSFRMLPDNDDIIEIAFGLFNKFNTVGLDDIALNLWFIIRYIVRAGMETTFKELITYDRKVKKFFYNNNDKETMFNFYKSLKYNNHHIHELENLPIKDILLPKDGPVAGNLGTPYNFFL